MGRLAVYILAASSEIADGLAEILGEFPPSGLTADVWVPIWPRSEEPVMWPPARELTSRDVEAFTGAPTDWVEGDPPPQIEPEPT